ncbi:LCP5 [Cyberlindnera jadinii]|uniref:LCP5 protein n=1 Tax=Cyberlindnera jadinii (strain ATCC 18201 / CBS 1600 / BCRC 20928 / JCM 3617 / NBRC 0987 / NRRL Y-1542) TaxID=983966 RepID=A0A0H5C3S2_CYBJN|nr:hypothetical protein CYBJADRAFT_165945 [Cyberlindnera jadinii NRRL Y-1542]ODV75189.1 hypothetical protein CYBJADRAFT_165945 [Cyberlindnera jadinii NRRL Y-1542]CEP22352.1 LCP5 [Cyberlindnera jadinii]
MSQSLNNLLRSIVASANATNDALKDLSSISKAPELPDLVNDLLQRTGQSLPEGVSLLDLKNNAMLSYINDIVLIILARIEATKTNDVSKIDELKDKAVRGSIVQRVTMERGIKGLEKKLQYQLDKMVRSYNKMEQEFTEDAINKKIKGDKEAMDGEESEQDEDEDSEEDELNYKPDPSALLASTKADKKNAVQRSTTAEGKAEKYKPPKIAAALPPQEFRESHTKSSKNSSKLQSMEEYLMETGEAPMVEASIGSTIVDHGRGGVKTLRDRQKEEEIKRFEESNFTRLSTTKSKKDKQMQKRRQADTFFGEDWGIFNNKRDDVETSTKRSKPKSAWDRAKKRRTH